MAIVYFAVMRIVRHCPALSLLILLLTSRGGAQPTAPVDPALLGNLRWRSIGPANTGGRIDDLAVARVPGQPDAIYVATASGGVFKSTNQGTSWTPIFDQVDAMMSIGDIAVAPSDPNVVWVGTGEANNRQSSSWGDGVYRSVDAGRTWKASGLADTRHIGRIVIHPTNPDVVYVAAVGHLWGSNSERGVFKTTDAGQTWVKVLYLDDNTGATDIVMDPQDPQTLFAAMYQRQRKAWGFNGGGPGSGIFRSRDGGATWTRLSNGLPQGDKGRIGLDIFHADPRVIFAVVEAAGRDSGVYRSADRGDTWQAWSTLNPRPMYYSQIRTDPRDTTRVYLLGSNRGFYISNDGGKTFADVFSTIHSEDHALWIDPDDTNHLIVGGDGGVSISWDRGQTWLFRDNLPVGQFYEISADMQDPYVICGGLQDNGHWCVPSATRNRSGISNHDAFNIGSGDGFYARLDPTDARTAIIESQDGRANRVNLSTLERQAVSPHVRRPGTDVPGTSRGRLSPTDRERWNWDTPIVMSSFDPKTLYMGSNMVFTSADRGATWKAISPDLTANIDRESLQMMGARVPERALSRHDGQASFSTLTTIGESPLDAKLLYTGSDDGRLSVTRDGGQKWTMLTDRIPGLPAGTYVSSVLPSRHLAGRVYATFDGHYNDDYRAYARDAPAVGGFGGAPQGPLVLPGVYTVTVNVAGRSLKGALHVEGDPRVTFPDTDRRTRQTVLLNLYALQKSLTAARAAGATAVGQLDAPGRSTHASRAEISGRLTQVQAELVAQFNAVNGLSRAIEGYSGLPTADQRRQLDWAFEDAAKTVEALNRVLQADTAPSRLRVPAKLKEP
jgi:photosystem II stability/assembly factor-like uncharacterized protein